MSIKVTSKENPKNLKLKTSETPKLQPLGNPNLTTFNTKASREAAAADREKKIERAIKAGAKVNYIAASSPISGEEQETHISIYRNSKGRMMAVIDTTSGPYITKCFKAGYKIRAVTFYREADGSRGRVAGVVFKCPANKISFRTL